MLTKCFPSSRSGSSGKTGSADVVAVTTTLVRQRRSRASVQGVIGIPGARSSTVAPNRSTLAGFRSTQKISRMGLTAQAKMACQVPWTPQPTIPTDAVSAGVSSP